MKPYRKFTSYEEAKDYFSEIGRLKLFGRVTDYKVYNFYHNDGRKYHMNIYLDGRVTYMGMSPAVREYWKSKGE